MYRLYLLGLLLLACLVGMAGTSADIPARGTAPPAQGWANTAPTLVEQVVDHQDTQLLEVSQGQLRAWVRVPRVDAVPGDYVLLGQGSPRRDIEIPGLGQGAPVVVDISHVQVADYETARQAVRTASPANAVEIGTVYAELAARADTEIVVYGTVLKAPQAVGWNWVHLQDGSGSATSGTHDITVKTAESVTVGQRVAFRGTLRKDVDLGFGYHYTALIEGGVLVGGEQSSS